MRAARLSAWSASAGRWTLALLAVDAIDELCTGTPPLAAPSIRAELGAAYSSLALLLLAVPLASCLVLEAPLLLWAARRRPERGVAHALAAQGLAFVWAAAARGSWSLLGALSAAMLATSVACALAQAQLIALHPHEPERILVRWTFLGAIGDMVTPVLFAIVQRWHGGFRAAFMGCAVLCLGHALIVVHSGLPAPGGSAPTPDDEIAQRPPLSAALRRVFARPSLLLWAACTMLCNLLDETLTVFGALHLREQRHFDGATTDLLVFALALGSAVGIAAADRLVARFSPLAVLGVSCVTCVGVFVLWLQMQTAWASALALGVLGMTIGPQYPLAQAQCYRRAREEPVLVSVLEGWLDPIHVLMPWLLGVLAERHGLGVTLGVLLLQPLGLLACIALTRGTAAEDSP